MKKRLYYIRAGEVVKICICFLLCLVAFCSCSLEIDIIEHLNSKATLTDNDPKVHFIDVGQGDSIFIELPNSQTMLIDAGESGNGELIENYISRECGYDKIDYLIATHPHADHIGSMAYIVYNMDIGSIYMTEATSNTKTFEKLLLAISEKGLKIKRALAGINIIKEDNLSVDIIGPIEVDEDDLNNTSIIIKLKYGEISFLFTGDAEKKELDSIKANMSADVLKVAHHGSNTSTYQKFLTRVNPSVAVISVGEDNSYYHPHKSTLRLLESNDISTYRTDEDGTVVVSFTQSDFDISTSKNSAKK